MQILASEQLIKILISIAVAATALITFYLSVRRFRMERAILAVGPPRFSSGCLELPIRNVGGRAALDVVVRSGNEAYAMDALKVGEEAVLRFEGGNAVHSVHLDFRDVDNWCRAATREIGWKDNRPFLKVRTVPTIWRRAPAMLGIGTAD